MIANRYDLLVFDLDGTLADTSRDLARSVNHALAGAGRERLSLETVVGYVGNGARRLIERCLSGGLEDVESVLGAFLEHYRANCLVETCLYPRVAETLAALRGKPLAVLTNKPLGPTRTILAGLGILDRFWRVEGGDSAPVKKPEPAGLQALIDLGGVTPERTLMLGDTAVDVLVARAVGAQVAGVTYGFRPGDLRDHPPDYLLGSLAELV